MPDSDTAAQTAADSLVNFLQQAGQYISELTLLCNEDSLTTVLQRAAAGLFNLTSLTMIGCLCVLPPPSQLPSLRHLSVTTEEVASLVWEESVAAVLPQVAKLCYRVVYFGQVAAVLRGSRQPLDGLIELEVRCLDGQIISAIARHCPQLRRVTAEVHISGNHRDEQWAVQELALEHPFFSDRGSGVDGAFQLAHLPRSAQSDNGERRRLRIVRPHGARTGGRVMLSVFEEGFSAVYAERLQDWSFATADITVVLHPRLNGYEAQHLALLPALRQLRALDAPGAVVSFKGWQWSQALADVLTEALPSLSHLNITVPVVTHNAGPDAKHDNSAAAAPGH